MADMCTKCGRMIKNEFDRECVEKDGELYEFHSDCFDGEEFYEDA